MRLRHFVLVFLVILSLDVLAQKKYKSKGSEYGSGKQRFRPNTGTMKRNPTDVFPLDREFRLSGWYAALGGTYMLPIKKGEGSGQTYSSASDSIQTFNSTTDAQFEAKPKGQLGLYAEVGYWHSMSYSKLFHFWEVGLTYRQYKGSEHFIGNSSTSQLVDSSGFISTGNSSADYDYVNSYSDQAISLAARISRQDHFSRYGFLQHSFGLNVDYFLSEERAVPVPPGFEGIYEPKYHGQLNAQLNYRLGIGWKASPTILIIPSIEIPFLNIYEFDQGFLAMPYFSTRQLPLIFTIRVMLLRRLSEDCNVPNYDGPANFQ